MPPILVILYNVPAYNKHFDEERRLTQNEKFKVLGEVGDQYYKLRSLKTGREVVLMKSYFVKPSSEGKKTKKKNIEWEN